MENFKVRKNNINNNNYIPIFNNIKKSNNIKKHNLKINIFFIYIFIIIIFFSLLIVNFKINNINKNVLLDSNSKLSKKSIKTNEISDEFIKNIKLIFNMMNKYTTFKIGGPAKYLVKPKEINQIIEINKLCNEYKVIYFILGNGSNLLVSDSGYYGVVILIHENNFGNLEVIKKNEEYIKCWSRNAYENIINRSMFIIINRIRRNYRYSRDNWRRDYYECIL